MTYRYIGPIDIGNVEINLNNVAIQETRKTVCCAAVAITRNATMRSGKASNEFRFIVFVET